jgi:hypothetical protein
VAKLQLHQGSYEARSPIANAQVCVNLYGEQNPPDAPFPVTMYPAPGLTLLSDYSAVFGGYVRGLYTTSTGVLIAVIGSDVISWQGPGNATPPILGSLGSNSGNPVSICDNDTDIVIVDGSSNGWYVPLAQAQVPGSLLPIDDPAFFGSNRVDYIDTFLIFNQPATQLFYTTTSNALLPFDPTYFAGKEGWNDFLQCCACLHDNIWLFGAQTTEIWFNAGGATFAFARMPNSILQQGCVAPYSVVVVDNAVYWLSQDRWGRNMLMRGEGYSARRVSTFAVEDEWSTYARLDDAVAMAYQLGGHETVGIYFPSAGQWWAYDAATQLWHKRTYNVTEPWLPYCMAGLGATPYVGNSNAIIAGDRTGPRLFQVDRNAYTDNGVAIQRQRSWMHQQEDGQRINYTRFAMSMAGSAMSPDTVLLDWSDDAGQTFGTPVPQTINNQTNGQYLWRRLGYGRDRVYRAYWTGVGEFALNGAYSDGIPEAT